MARPLPPLIVVALIAASHGAGCNATPVPQPPPGTLDFGKIGLAEAQPATYPPSYVFEADAGAGPPGHTLRVTNIDDDAPPSDTVIAADGSFRFTIGADLGHELRFQTLSEGGRSAPVDRRFDVDGLQPTARIDCATLDPPLQHDLGAIDFATTISSSVTVRNDCPATLRIDDASLRTMGSDFVLPASSYPVALEPGASTTIDVEVTPSNTGEVEEVLRVRLSLDANVARHPITLFADSQ
jgi:hypothetical protein